jgi:sialate O-acetylesterase
MTTKKYITTLFSQILLMLAFSMHVFATVKLPAVFSNGMVLQQKSKVAIWGWAKSGEKVTVTTSWLKQAVSTTATANGKWKLLLNTSIAGGPYTIKVSGENVIELKDVLLGEVWVCSGQSNMVFSLKASYKAKEEIAKADFLNIRYFSVQRQYGPEEFEDAPDSKWQKTSPETAPSFSAVAYYFAKKIHRQLNVPIGIVYAAWGGNAC